MPVLAIVTSFVMTLPVALDILDQARRGDWLSSILLGLYALAGLSIYLFYGRPRAQRQAATSQPTCKEAPPYADSH